MCGVGGAGRAGCTGEGEGEGADVVLRSVGYRDEQEPRVRGVIIYHKRWFLLTLCAPGGGADLPPSSFSRRAQKLLGVKLQFFVTFPIYEFRI